MKQLFHVIAIISLLGCHGYSKSQTIQQNNHQKLFTTIELENKPHEELRLLRNEIFAHHGYIFKDKKLLEYFSNFDWYSPIYDNVNHLLTEIDRRNISLILSLENKEEKHKSDNPIIGQWLNRKYFESLIKSKSPKISQSEIYLAYIDFKTDGNSTIIFSFHEGVNRGYFTKNDTIIFDNPKFSSYKAYMVNSNTMIFSDESRTDTLIKYESIDCKGNNIAINKLVFEGKYLNRKDSTIVEFHSSGHLTGLNNYNSYEVRDDYQDIALDVDMLYLNNLTEKKKLTWDFENDTLLIYNIICKDYDSSAEACMEVGKGELVYRLQKINDKKGN